MTVDLERVRVALSGAEVGFGRNGCSHGVSTRDSWEQFTRIYQVRSMGSANATL